jgi:hypothetical protein
MSSRPLAVSSATSRSGPTYSLPCRCLFPCWPRLACSDASYHGRPYVRTVIAANLLVVGLVYHYVLSEPFKPTWAFQADLYLHYITPVLYLADWFFCVPRTRLAWWTATRSIILPLVYGIWLFGYSAIAQWYPYPFIEVQALGIAEILLNLFCLLSVFVITTTILILVDRLVHRGEHTTTNLQLVHECSGADRHFAAVHYSIGKCGSRRRRMNVAQPSRLTRTGFFGAHPDWPTPTALFPTEHKDAHCPTTSQSVKPRLITTTTSHGDGHLHVAGLYG